MTRAQVCPRQRTTVGARSSRAMLARAGVTALAGVVSLALGCKPDFGAPPSLIGSAQLLEVRARPAEASPGTPVTLDVLLADPGGTVTAPVAWTICRTPKPPAESNAVSRACVDQPDDGDPVSGPTTIALPTDACSLFGPLTPPAQPGQAAVRPRDPDATGGFYQPIRAAVRAGASGGGGPDLVGFGLIRISCALANAPADVAKAFNDPETGYHANRPPQLLSVTSTDAAGVEQVLFGEGLVERFTVRAGDVVSLRVAWGDDAAETFPVFDIASRTLVATREALRVSWFTTAGEFVHDRTGRASDEMETISDNTWTAPSGMTSEATVFFWVVLRDSRGGSDFALFQATLLSP